MRDANDMIKLSQRLGGLLLAHQQKLVTAESCTGGWIAQVITDTPGSSQWFERGYVTYSNDAKSESLGVNSRTLQHHGAVSKACASEMALGALQHSHAHIAIATTGIAGPDGGSEEKPVGTVWFALATISELKTILHYFDGDRQAIRQQAVVFALTMLCKQLEIR
ncbi:MAG: nicotinamide-nucleotide amidase [Pseudomonadota bacterium]